MSIKRIGSVLLACVSLFFMLATIISAFEFWNPEESFMVALFTFVFFSLVTFYLIKTSIKLWVNPNNNPTVTKANLQGNTIQLNIKDIAEMILADDVIHEEEVKHLFKILNRHDISSFEPLELELYQVLNNALKDDKLDQNESSEIRVLLSEVCDKELSRVNFRKKSTDQPKLKKQPDVKIPQQQTWVESRKDNKHDELALKLDDILFLSYTDSSGKKSEREILFRSINRKNGNTYLNGLCQTKGGYRTFRVDRISILTLATTGEIISDIKNFFDNT